MKRLLNKILYKLFKKRLEQVNIHIVISQREILQYDSDKSFTKYIKHKMIRELVEFMYENNFIKFTQTEDANLLNRRITASLMALKWFK